MQIDRRTFLSRLGISAAAVQFLGTALASETTNRIVFIHGPSPDEGTTGDAMRDVWLGSLRTGAKALTRDLPTNLEVVTPYYGNALNNIVREHSLPLVSQMLSRGTSEQSDFLEFQAEVAEEIRRRIGVTDE